MAGNTTVFPSLSQRYVKILRNEAFMRYIGAPERNAMIKVPMPVYLPEMSSLDLDGMNTAGSIRAVVVINTVISPLPTMEVVQNGRLPLWKRIYESNIVNVAPIAANKKEYPQLKGCGTAKFLWRRRLTGPWAGVFIRNGPREQ